MNLMFAPRENTFVRIRSHGGSWYAHVETTTDVTCAHGESFSITVDYRREITHEDSDTVLDAFEAALRAGAAQTQEQKVQVSEGVHKLLAVLTDEAVYFQFTDPCTVP